MVTIDLIRSLINWIKALGNRPFASNNIEGAKKCLKGDDGSVKIIPNGNIEIDGEERLSPAASKSLDDEFEKTNPELVDGEEWN